MKTHALASSLSKLSRALRSIPDMELEDLLSGMMTEFGTGRAHSDNPNAAATVGILASLSRISKSQWKELIENWKLPIDVLRKDSARNIMGEVMRYLEAHPNEIRRIQNGTTKESSQASPALLKALQILLASDKGMASDDREESQPRD